MWCSSCDLHEQLQVKDASQGLRTAYGVGELAGALLKNPIIELCFTSSVRFLQPGLLLTVGIKHAVYQGFTLFLHRSSDTCGQHRVRLG